MNIDYIGEQNYPMIPVTKANISKYKAIPLSTEDIMHLLDGKCNVIMYPNLHKYDSIHDLIHPYNACVILYETKPHYGHWCCLTVRTEGSSKVLSFFDPYGCPIDSQLENIPEPFATTSHQDYPYLGNLILNTWDSLIEYNEFQFQKLDKTTKDCGRWCCIRIMFKHLSIDEFKELFYGPYADELVTFLTADTDQIKTR